jgi:hypothetical protein
MRRAFRVRFIEGGHEMRAFTVVKVFDYSVAPLELQNTIESAMIRPSPGHSDAALVAIWVGARASSLEKPSEACDPPKVTAWEHCLHKWLRRSGADAGDVVLLSWGSLAPAQGAEPTAVARAARPRERRPRPVPRAKQPAVH